jgi:hypothetical protein
MYCFNVIPSLGEDVDVLSQLVPSLGEDVDVLFQRDSVPW